MNVIWFLREYFNKDRFEEIRHEYILYKPISSFKLKK